MRVVDLRDELKLRRAFGFFDDFEWLISPHRWTNLAADVGTTAFAEGDRESGRLSGATGATDNNEIDIRTTTEPFLVAANRQLIFEARIQYTEANTDDANVMVGFMSALAADSLVDNGGGVRTTGNSFVIYKIDGGTVWRASSRNGTEVEDTVSVQTAGGTAYQVLTVLIDDWDAGTTARASYYLDGQPLTDSNNNEIVHTIAIASSTEMNAGAYIKAGGATTETLLIDYIAAYQSR